MSEIKNSQLIRGIILIVLGAIFLFSLNLGDLIGKLWPLILIALGIYFIYKTKHRENDDSEPHTTGSESGVPGFAGDIRVSGLQEGVGSISKSLLLGDVVIDLTGAKLLDGENNIDVSVLIGDVTIVTPTDFPLKVDLTACIGDLKFRQKRIDGFIPSLKHTDDNYSTAQARLSIKGRLCFGNIKILTA
jgi:predicted membrane protein